MRHRIMTVTSLALGALLLLAIGLLGPSSGPPAEAAW